MQGGFAGGGRVMPMGQQQLMGQQQQQHQMQMMQQQRMHQQQQQMLMMRQQQQQQMQMQMQPRGMIGGAAAQPRLSMGMPASMVNSSVGTGTLPQMQSGSKSLFATNTLTSAVCFALKTKTLNVSLPLDP